MSYRACVVNVQKDYKGDWYFDYIEVSPWCNLSLAENWLAAFEKTYENTDYVCDIEESEV